MLTQKLYVLWAHVNTYKLSHTLLYTSLKGRAFRAVAWQLCHPLTTHSDGADKTPVCLTHSPPEQRHSSVTDMEYGRPARPPLLGAFNISVLVSDVEVLKGVREVCCGWKHDRDTDWERGVPYGVRLLKTISPSFAFLFIYFLSDRLSRLCPVFFRQWIALPFNDRWIASFWVTGITEITG